MDRYRIELPEGKTAGIDADGFCITPAGDLLFHTYLTRRGYRTKDYMVIKTYLAGEWTKVQYPWEGEDAEVGADQP